MIRSILLLLLCPALVLAEEKPNLLFILADDLGYGDLGCYGATDIETPHLDGLAEKGIRFTDAYSNGAVCTPTRIAFLTGQYQQRFGMDNALYYQEMGRGLPIGGKTIASRLQKAGYATGISGKWHVGYDHGRQPLQQGFDHFFGLLGGNHHYFEHMDRIGVPDLWHGNEPVAREGYTTELITDDAISFLEKNQARPFFLFLSHAAPHFPWQGPEDRSRKVEPKKKSWQQGDRETYIRMVESMDDEIGRVLSRLDELELTNNTLIIFTSDNGGHTYSSNAPLAGSKGSLSEGGIRVPCLASWQGTIPAGHVSSTPVITMDWTATLAALGGSEDSRSQEEGENLLLLLTGNQPDTKRTFFWRKQPGPKRKSVEPARAVRHGKWKWLESTEGAFLFDLDEDPAETTNLYSKFPEIVADLQARHDAWREDVDTP